MVKNDCIFCKIVDGKLKSEIIAESKNFLAMLDINQDIKGHTLIIPKKHYANLLEIDDKLGNEMLEFIKKISSDLLKNGLGDGFNILMNNFECAGQVVNHAHIHIIPRKEGDKLKVSVQ